MSIGKSVSPLEFMALQNELKLAHENIRLLTDVVNACVQQLNRAGGVPIKGIQITGGVAPKLLKF